MNKITHTKKTNHGFTLIEVILSLGLTAMILGLLSTGVFIVAEDWNRNSDILDESLDEALAILQLDRALHGAFPHSYTNEETLGREIYFFGEEDRLSWVSTVSPQRNPGLTAWELFSVEDEGTYLNLVPAFSDNPELRIEEKEPILFLKITPWSLVISTKNLERVNCGQMSGLDEKLKVCHWLFMCASYRWMSCKPRKKSWR